SSPSASPSPCSDITSTYQPAPAQLLVQAAAKVGAVLDFHALDRNVDSSEPASIQRHHGLRASLAYQRERRTGDDAARSQRRDARRRRLEEGPSDPVALRDVADHAAEAVVDLRRREAQPLQHLGERLAALLHGGDDGAEPVERTGAQLARLDELVHDLFEQVAEAFLKPHHLLAGSPCAYQR